MRLLTYALLSGFLLTWNTGCVDPEEINDFRGKVDVIVVDGTINNLDEPQQIRLNRSRADPFSGRFGTLPVKGASVAIVVDSAQVIPCHETVDGTYVVQSDFRGQVGHAYQLRFTLKEGIRYESSQQVMPPVTGVGRIRSQFNPKSLSPPINHFFTAGHDLFVDFADPAATHDYYRWEWKLFEKQQWCKTCYQGIYSVNQVVATLQPYYYYPPGYTYRYSSDNTKLLEDCYTELTPPSPSIRNPLPEYRYDYPCRTQCWEIIYSHDISLFNDALSNGGLITGRKVAQIPYYDHNPALVEIRQGSLTADAYGYLDSFGQQTQNTGGLADTPPTVLPGNVHNVANSREVVVGYFIASSITTGRYWLDRKDTSGLPLGVGEPGNPSVLDGAELFYALNLRQPILEPSPPYQPQLYLLDSPPRPPTALCVPSDTKTPYKPEGWRD